MAYLLGIKVEYISIYPLGGISHFKMPLNIKPIKELLILIMGPIFQIIAYLILIELLPDNKNLIEYYHWHILFFNLLPIIPLDGGKLLLLFIQKIIPYYYSYKLLIVISIIISISILIINKININIIITIILLVVLMIKEYKKIDIIYQKFLLERYLNNYHFKRKRIITNEKYFYRNLNHIIKLGDNYYLEKDYLRKKYEKNKKSY